MGLRDALKSRVKAVLLGERPAPPPASAPTTPSVAAKPGANAPGPAPAAADVPVAVPAAPALPTTAAAPAAVPPGAFRVVAPAAAVREGRPGTYAHAGLNVAVFRAHGRLYAIDNACAHEDGPIGEGAVEGNCVRCPYHDWQYDFTTGACITDPERPRATFAVREAEGSIWLGPMLTAGSDSRGGEHDDGLEVFRT